MTKLGFIVSENDPCLFLKKDIKVGLYVNDFMVFAKNTSLIEELHANLVDRYDDVKINIGSRLNFLGMSINIFVNAPHMSIST